MNFKICTKCGKSLPETTEYFCKRWRGKNGFNSICKSCRNKSRIKYEIESYDKDKIKICSKCNKEFPATPEYFHKNCYSRDGLHSECKECSLGYEFFNRPIPKDGYKFCKTCGAEKLATTEFFWAAKRNKDGLDGSCKDCTRPKSRIRYKRNKDTILKYQKSYYKINRDYVLERDYKYRQTPEAKERIDKYKRKLRKTKKWKRMNREYKAKHRKMGYIEMFENPFDESEEVEWHHIGDSAYVVAIPKDLHKVYGGNAKHHKFGCMKIIEQIYLWL